MNNYDNEKFSTDFRSDCINWIGIQLYALSAWNGHNNGHASRVKK